MLKTREEIEKYIEEKYEEDFPEAILSALEERGFDDCSKYLNPTIFEYVSPSLFKIIHQIRQDDLEAVKEVITKNIEIYSLLQKHLADEKAEALQDLLNQLNNLNK